MNDTPRTEELLDRLGNNQILPNDNNAGGWSSIDMNAMIDFARQLEREIAVAKTFISTIETPRTDAVCRDDFMVNHESSPPEIYVPKEFAQELERELNDALCEINQLKDNSDNAGMERDLQD